MLAKLAIATLSWMALIALAAYLLRRWVAPRRTVCVNSFALGGAAIAMLVLVIASVLIQFIPIPPSLGPFRTLV